MIRRSRRHSFHVEEETGDDECQQHYQRVGFLFFKKKIDHGDGHQDEGD